jgi:hypothetical protein
VSTLQFAEQCFGILQVSGIESPGIPAVDLSEHRGSDSEENCILTNLLNRVIDAAMAAAVSPIRALIFALVIGTDESALLIRPAKLS